MSSSPNRTHPVSWWAELISSSERFDAAYFVEELSSELIPQIANPLVRREVELAVATMNRHLLRPSNEEFADDAAAGRDRLAATLDRLNADIPEAEVIRHAVWNEYPRAAAAAERLITPSTVLHIAVTALRFQGFDVTLAVRLLNAGRPPAAATRAGTMMGRYGWWPDWLKAIATERALAGKLDEKIIAALDRCAYAPLTTAQMAIARRMFHGDLTVLAAAVDQLHHLGEHKAARALHDGDLTQVALAAKLMSL